MNAAEAFLAGGALHALKGWLAWYQRTDDDDCEYLNSTAWADAEALASTTMGTLAALNAYAEGKRAQPIAWLLRETKLGRARIMPGHCFKSAERADAAAARMTGRWRTVTAVPVQEAAQQEGTADGR